jgi:hypothetical protein
MSRPNSRGDPRVHLLINLVLSALFAWTVIWGLSYISEMEFSLESVAMLTGVLMVLTHLVTR